MKKENDKTPNEITLAAFNAAEFSNKEPQRTVYTNLKEKMTDLRRHMDDVDIIWGVNSEGTNLKCDQWSLNDIELVRWKGTGEYSIGVETVYGFEYPNQRVVYLKRLLRAFTVWMQEQGYCTDLQPTLHNVFNRATNRFKTIEEAYIDFKVRVSGYCALVEDYHGRDPKRIHSLLVKLEEAWKTYPDLRFGQFMTNFFCACGRDPFYVEDDIWMKAIQAYIAGKDPGKVINDYLNKKNNRQ